MSEIPTVRVPLSQLKEEWPAVDVMYDLCVDELVAELNSPSPSKLTARKPITLPSMGRSRESELTEYLVSRGLSPHQFGLPSYPNGCPILNENLGDH